MFFNEVKISKLSKKKFFVGVFVWLTVVFAVSFVAFLYLKKHTLQNEQNEETQFPSILTSKKEKERNFNQIEVIPPEIREVKMLFAGDVMLARSLGDKILAGENPFKYVKDKFGEYDIVVINLECVLSDKGEKQAGKLYTFEAPVESINLIKESHIDVVSLANNHTMDYGEEAFLDMLKRLDEAGIKQVGGGKNKQGAFAPLILEHNNTKISVLAFNDIETSFNAVRDNRAGGAYFDKNLIVENISYAKNNSDIVIPFVHWGIEFNTSHTAHQASWAETFVDNGSDIVIGNHPHIIQPVETYKGKTIYYSIGNFVFDQMYLGAADGYMVEVTIQNGEIVDSKPIKIRINEEGFPQIIQ